MSGRVVVSEEAVQVTTTEEAVEVRVVEGDVRTVELGVMGPQGPKGETGEQGPQGETGPPDAWRYVHDQAVPSAVWTIAHSLGGFPNVTTADSAGTVVEGEVEYLDANNLRVSFAAAFAGVAYLS